MYIRGGCKKIFTLGLSFLLAGYLYFYSGDLFLNFSIFQFQIFKFFNFNVQIRRMTSRVYVCGELPLESFWLECVVRSDLFPTSRSRLRAECDWLASWICRQKLPTIKSFRCEVLLCTPKRSQTFLMYLPKRRRRKPAWIDSIWIPIYEFHWWVFFSLFLNECRPDVFECWKVLNVYIWKYVVFSKFLELRMLPNIKYVNF